MYTIEIMMVIIVVTVIIVCRVIFVISVTRNANIVNLLKCLNVNVIEQFSMPKHPKLFGNKLWKEQ